MATNFTKVGDEVQINLAPNLNDNQFEPDVAALNDGRFFVVFTDSDTNDDIVGQFVNPDGTLSGVNNIDIEDDAGDQDSQAVAGRADGGAIVVWRDLAGSGEIEFATVSSTGVVSGEFDVLFGANNFIDPDVAVLADGRALVVATEQAASNDIAFNFVNAAGNGTIGQDVLDNSAGAQDEAAVAAFGNNALVVYRDDSAGGDFDIVARFYNGTSFETEFTIADGSASTSLDNPEIAALSDGRFIVVWDDDDTDTIHGRFVSAVGVPLGSTFVISDEGGENEDQSVAALPDGGFVVTWTNDGGLFPTDADSADDAVVARRFDSNGAPAGDLFLVNIGDQDSNQYNPAMAVNAAGGSFITWEDDGVRPGGDNDPSGIRGQAFSSAIEVVNGSAGADLLEGFNLAETINGLDGNDNIRALGGDDIVDGGLGKDILSGGDGNDTLNGGLGHDVLLGDAGADNFLFNTAIKPKGSNVDTIADFSAAEDTILLAGAIFTKLKLGALKEKAFFEGDEAHDKNDRIVYDDKSGELIYDKNGDKKGGEVVFAHLDPKLDLSAADFLVV